MKRPTPEEIDRMTPREAFTAGDAYGRESITEAFRRDEQAAAASQSAEAKAKIDERIAAIERRLTGVENEQRDNAKAIIGVEKRITALEGGKVS